MRGALALGVTRFDVAPSYGLGSAEATLARALGAERYDSRVRVTTKVGIAPPKGGALKTWLREPYRLARRLLYGDRRGRLPAFPNGHVRLIAAPPDGPPIDVRGSIEASLRRLKVERFDTLLTHEAVNEDCWHELRTSFEEFLDTRQVEKTGASGAIGAVRRMLSALGPQATVAQISAFDLASAPPVAELRIFNIVAFARVHLESSATEMARLRDLAGTSSQTEATTLAAAATIAWLRRRRPNAQLILNASTPERLEALVVASEAPGLMTWLEVPDNPLELLHDPA